MAAEGCGCVGLIPSCDKIPDPPSHLMKYWQSHIVLIGEGGLGCQLERSSQSNFHVRDSARVYLKPDVSSGDPPNQISMRAIVRMRIC